MGSRKAAAESHFLLLVGGTLIHCYSHGKRIWDDKLPPLVIDDMPLGVEVAKGFSKVTGLPKKLRGAAYFIFQ